jgi:hypothetical protein
MSGVISIRAARGEDRAFVAGLALSLLEYGSPAWQDVRSQVDGFREVLARAVTAQGSDAAVLIAEDADQMRLGFISIKVKHDVTGIERTHSRPGRHRHRSGRRDRHAVDESR